jgi:DNA repair exonuclease SbcCD ATPase subunit
MKASALEQEVAALRQEVERLRQKKSKLAPPKNAKTKAKAKQKSETQVPSEAEIKKILTDALSQIKNDYENLSPVTALLLFALGALLGSSLTKNKGGR